MRFTFSDSYDRHPAPRPERTDYHHPAAEALGKLYEQFTNVQNLAEFHAALRKRDALKLSGDVG
jgi:hypothetical protein